MTFTAPSEYGGDYEGALDYLFEDIETVLDLHGQQGCKFFMGIDVGVAQMIEDRTSMVSFATTATPLLPSDDTLLEAYDHMQRLVHKVDDFMRDGSGWISHEVKGVYLYVTRFVQIRITFIHC